jgi:pimeloyl-ACP methyl ester carboxylesterase
LTLPIFDPWLDEVSIEALGRHVVRFLDALNIGRAVIGGNSLGGHVAPEVALSCPDRLSGLILTGSSGLFERTFTRRVPHRPSAAYVKERMEEVFYDPTLVTPAWVESIRERLATPGAAMRVVRFARAARRHHVENRLPGIRVPTLLVWGRDDRVTAPDVAERLVNLMPDARLSLLARCGHAPMIGRPEAFNDVVAGWLAATRARRERPVTVGGGVR